MKEMRERFIMISQMIPRENTIKERNTEKVFRERVPNGKKCVKRKITFIQEGTSSQKFRDGTRSK